MIWDFISFVHCFLRLRREQTFPSSTILYNVHYEQNFLTAASSDSRTAKEGAKQAGDIEAWGEEARGGDMASMKIYG
jgi:hypothetical protein